MKGVKGKKALFLGGLSCLLFSLIIWKGVSDRGPSGHSASNEHGSEEHKEHDEHDEGKQINLTKESFDLSGISMAVAGPRSLNKTMTLFGQIVPNQERLAKIGPRYPGIVKAIFKNPGDQVAEGEVLATIEANTGLSTYQIRAKFPGTVVNREAVAGQFVSEKNIIFTISDLEVVWVHLNVTENDISKIREGNKVILQLSNGSLNQEASINYVSPLIHEDSQTLMARVIIPNLGGEWRPGSFVSAKVVLEEKEASLAVPEKALQILENKKVIFVKKQKQGNAKDDEDHHEDHEDHEEEIVFEVRPVDLGISGEGWTEIKNGLKKGETYVVENSFILKSELLKATSGHDHAH